MPHGSDMDRLARDLASAPERAIGAAASAAQKALKVAVDSGYRDRKDIHGKTYIPAKDGHLPQMDRTGKLKGSYNYDIRRDSRGATIRVSEDTSYGQYLRDGTEKMKPREHIPKSGDPMPARWDALVRPAIERAIKREEGRVP